MTSRKGELTRRQIDRAFPHQVVVRIPAGGLGAALPAMHETARALGRHATRSQRGEDGGDAMAFCFADPGAAGSFIARHGGELADGAR